MADKLVKLVNKLYSDFEVQLKIGKEKSSIKIGCGVRQQPYPNTIHHCDANHITDHHI